jgi:hypothetical protein
MTFILSSHVTNALCQKVGRIIKTMYLLLEIKLEHYQGQILPFIDNRNPITMIQGKIYYQNRHSQ